MEQSNQRHFFRIPLDPKPCGKISILKIKEDFIETKNREVCIEDISAGGVRFITDLDFPLVDDVVYSFEFELLDQVFVICGKLVRREEVDIEVYEYGLRFLHFEKDTTTLVRTLNDFAVRQRRRQRTSESEAIIAAD